MSQKGCCNVSYVCSWYVETIHPLTVGMHVVSQKVHCFWPIAVNTTHTHTLMHNIYIYREREYDRVCIYLQSVHIYCVCVHHVATSLEPIFRHMWESSRGIPWCHQGASLISIRDRFCAKTLRIILEPAGPR